MPELLEQETQEDSEPPSKRASYANPNIAVHDIRCVRGPNSWMHSCYNTSKNIISRAFVGLYRAIKSSSNYTSCGWGPKDNNDFAAIYILLRR